MQSETLVPGGRKKRSTVIPVKKRSVTDEINERIKTATGPALEKYNEEQDPKRKLRSKYRLLRTARKAVVLEISGLKRADWEKYIEEQGTALGEWIERSEKEIIDQRLSQGELNLQDVGLLMAEDKLAETLIDITHAEKKAVSKTETANRFLLFYVLEYFKLLYGVHLWSVGLEPLNHLTGIVSKRFGADHNWITAAALLAVHENLVKKKLVELGEPEDKMVKEGIGFDNLVSLLAQRILEKEGRKVTLSFYRTSSLRIVRNKLQHEGYKLTVNWRDVLDLVKDIRKFDAEIYPVDPVPNKAIQAPTLEGSSNLR